MRPRQARLIDGETFRWGESSSPVLLVDIGLTTTCEFSGLCTQSQQTGYKGYETKASVIHHHRWNIGNSEKEVSTTIILKTALRWKAIGELGFFYNLDADCFSLFL